MPTQRTSGEHESGQSRQRSMTHEVMARTSASTRERVTARETQVHQEVERAVDPFARALLRFKDAIILAQTGRQAASASPDASHTRARAVTRVVTEGDHSFKTYRTRETVSETAELLTYFVGDNTASMNHVLGEGLMNLDSASSFAQVEGQVIGLMSEGMKELGNRSDVPFRSQTILFGFPQFVTFTNPENPYKKETINVADKGTGAFIEQGRVFAKAVTPLGKYTDIDEEAVLTMQGSDDFRGGPTLLAPALELVIQELKANGVSASDFQNGKKAGIVFVASDFGIHDEDRAKEAVEALRKMGVRVVALGIGGKGSVSTDTMNKILNSDGKNHGKFCQSPEEIVAFVHEQAALEDSSSGVDTSVPVVTERAVTRRTRAATREVTGSRYTGEN